MNLFEGIPESLEQEWVERIIVDPPVRIERIISKGQASPPDFWYDQDEHEWITVLKGRAQLQLAAQAKPITLGPGDTLFLPAHTKHRVAWTDPAQDTIWLAVFWNFNGMK